MFRILTERVLHLYGVAVLSIIGYWSKKLERENTCCVWQHNICASSFNEQVECHSQAPSCSPEHLNWPSLSYQWVLSTQPPCTSPQEAQDREPLQKSPLRLAFFLVFKEKLTNYRLSQTSNITKIQTPPTLTHRNKYPLPTLEGLFTSL